jgi:DNA-binding GntR family transcriptional regulator
MIGCQNCTIQLHPECLVDDVLTKTYNKLAKGQIKDQVNNSAANVKATKHQVKIARKQKRQSARPYYGKFEAVIKDKEKAPCIEITDLRLVEGQRATWQEDIYCPKCSAKLK